MSISQAVALSRIAKARSLGLGGEIAQAQELLLPLTDDETVGGAALYYLGMFANALGDPLRSRECFTKAFLAMPNVCKVVFTDKHQNSGYVFENRYTEEPRPACPLCGGAGAPHWTYCLANSPVSLAHVYNPVRLWMRCAPCNHLWASHFPTMQQFAAAGIMESPAHKFQFRALPFDGEILSRLFAYTPGRKAFEVGLGGGSMALAAIEMGYEYLGIDVNANAVKLAHKMGINAQCADFMDFACAEKFDMILMGDVLEHITHPAQAIKKAISLMNDGAVIWISTPNFEGSYTRHAGHDDSMRHEASHANYFSKHSLLGLLAAHGLSAVDYRISKHYYGSMEVTAVLGDAQPQNFFI